jgi:hypothetical protein
VLKGVKQPEPRDWDCCRVPRAEEILRKGTTKSYDAQYLIVYNDGKKPSVTSEKA